MSHWLTKTKFQTLGSTNDIYPLNIARFENFLFNLFTTCCTGFFPVSFSLFSSPFCCEISFWLNLVFSWHKPLLLHSIYLNRSMWSNMLFWETLQHRFCHPCRAHFNRLFDILFIILKFSRILCTHFPCCIHFDV